VWFAPALVPEILSAELTLSPNYTAGWGQIKEQAGLAMRFLRFTGRWRDDKALQDAITTQELTDLYHTARRAPAATRAPSITSGCRRWRLLAAVPAGEPTLTGRPDR
jgi:hypothetical protein